MGQPAAATPQAQVRAFLLPGGRLSSPELVGTPSCPASRDLCMLSPHQGHLYGRPVDSCSGPVVHSLAPAPSAATRLLSAVEKGSLERSFSTSVSPLPASGEPLLPGGLGLVPPLVRIIPGVFPVLVSLSPHDPREQVHCPLFCRG